MNKWGNWIVMGAMLLVWAGRATAVTDGEKCEASKLKAAGKYSFCRMKSDAKSAKTGDLPDYTKCDAKLVGKFTSIDTLYGSECPTASDAADVQSQATQCAEGLALKLSGVRFIDNGDGTVTDTQSGFIWEQKVAGTGCTHCEVDRTWAGTQDWISELNRDGFAGKHEWAMPTPEDLQDILDCETVGSVTTCTLDPIFGPAPTQTVWTGFAGSVVSNAQCVDLATGDIVEGPKDDSMTMGASRARVRNNAH